MTVKELAERSAKFTANLEKHIQEVVNDNDILISLNRKQLKQSRLSTGQPIRPLYSRSYSDYKGFQTPDLRDTGDFYAAMFIRYQQTEYILSSTDWKTLKLMDKYTPEIFGISKENQPFAQKVTSVMLSDVYKREVLS